MNEKKKRGTGKFVAKLCIWTIKNHNLLITHLRLYMWAAVASVLYLCLANRISLQAGLNGILFGGFAIFFILWVLLENRRTCLLNISDPKLKNEAYNVMIAFIAQRQHKLKNQGYLWNKIWNKIIA
jgi:hypothetical protein